MPMPMPVGYDQLDREVGRDVTPTIPPTCANCGYDLRGAVSMQCPECGHVTLRAEAAQLAEKTKRAIAEYKEALEWGRRGMYIGAVGLAAAMWGLTLSSGWLQPLLRLISLLAGPIAFFFGLSVLRAQSLPRPIRDQFETSASHSSSALAIVFGIADTLAGILGTW